MIDFIIPLSKDKQFHSKDECSQRLSIVTMSMFMAQEYTLQTTPDRAIQPNPCKYVIKPKSWAGGGGGGGYC